MGSARTLYNEVVAAIGLDRQDVTAAGATVTSYDRDNSGNPVHDLIALIDVGTITTGPATVTMVESDSTDVASAMTAVDDDEVLGDNPLVLTTSNDAALHKLGYLGNSRYVGFTLSVTGTAGDLQIIHVAGNPRDAITA